MVTHTLHMCIQQEAGHAENSRLDGYTHVTYVSESIVVTHSCHKIADQKQLRGVLFGSQLEGVHSTMVDRHGGRSVR